MPSLIRLVLACAVFSTVLLTSKAKESIVSEGVINAPVSAVWKAWTTSEGLRAWLAPQVEIDLRIDGLMRTNYDANAKLSDASTIENRILAFEPERLLVIRVVKAPENFPFRNTVGDMWTVLHFTPVDENKTNLRIVGLGFGGNEASQKMRAFFQQGNDYTLLIMQKHFP